MKKILVSLVAGLLLAGCATQKPQMSEGDYSRFSKGWAAIHQCHSSGYIDTDTAALAKRYMGGTMQQYVFDSNKMDNQANWYLRNGSSPSQDDCRNLAVSVRTRQQQIAENNAQLSAQSSPAMGTKPTSTYCNRIGTQVFCNSF